ncbi:hypothetical protein C8Q80DRAFT_208818 [Daedaleopsis nitida]|nr:hypothetical protein C8Q80DRAFT_208818 [Daedaleopsis nitida]
MELKGRTERERKDAYRQRLDWRDSKLSTTLSAPRPRSPAALLRPSISLALVLLDHSELTSTHQTVGLGQLLLAKSLYMDTSLLERDGRVCKRRRVMTAATGTFPRTRFRSDRSPCLNLPPSPPSPLLAFLLTHPNHPRKSELARADITSRHLLPLHPEPTPARVPPSSVVYTRSTPSPLTIQYFRTSDALVRTKLCGRSSLAHLLRTVSFVTLADDPINSLCSSRVQAARPVLHLLAPIATGPIF